MTEDSLRRALQALALIAADDVEGGHKLVRDDSSRVCAWVHAHVHRIQGDPFGALYFYLRARKPIGRGAHELERRAIEAALTSLLKKPDDARAAG
ncbi:hypothetical protein [Sphingopyxis indica]|uniref:Uncharacterized protein n=1 Tax=Sphingopyxis indica TaxID=436663 RepID=A0A239LB13_9SPHN|nr:hypothetical protein [Sphingopyxis indica]SNT27480.1 hypothetical protein SAMN06295955_12123 [Sphingopyxis indica]